MLAGILSQEKAFSMLGDYGVKDGDSDIPADDRSMTSNRAYGTPQ